MLSEQSTPVIRATLPAVGAAIGEISMLFYAKLFEDRPDLLRDLFNRGNQANGTQRQALAGSFVAFARMLVEHPSARPDTMLARIANKHASLGITADQYKLVHDHLLGATGDVLGGAVTAEVAAAWDEVYWLMANTLIAIEARLSEDAGVVKGTVWRRMRIVERREQTPDAVSFTLADAAGAPAGTFRPGQYVSVQVRLPDGARQIRQYSLTGNPGDPQWRITVKRVRDGAAPEGEVSSWLHENARAGDSLTVSAPFGDLVLPEAEGPLLLASAGIGITPMMSMLHHLAGRRSRRPVTVLHADRSARDHAHRAEQRRLVQALPNGALHLWYEELGDDAGKASPGQADVTALSLPEGLTAYLCGPLPFMRAVRGDLLRCGVAARAVHYEVFGPDLWLGRD